MDKKLNEVLINAVINGNFDKVKTLLSSGANINIADNNGSTPLYIASKKGHINIVETLLSSGANINLADKEGKTALQIAKEKKKTEIIKLLEEAERIKQEEEARKEMVFPFFSLIY